MGEKEDSEKSVDFVSDQERDYAQIALNEFNKYVGISAHLLTINVFKCVIALSGVTSGSACKIWTN